MAKTPAKKPAKERAAKADTPAPETVLVLRTAAADGSSYNGFRWPESGPVEAPDWAPVAECGQGLHGWLWGQGDWSLKCKDDDARWIVVEVVKADVIDLAGKVKFPRGVVLATFGHWRDAMAFIRARRPVDEEMTVATGISGHASATGYSGHASATGRSGHASATGDYGHASATGYYGWSVGGYHSRVKAAGNGALTALYWDEAAKRPRVAVAYVGEDGIKADTWYRVEAGRFVEVES
jgi:hypothetical protein